MEDIITEVSNTTTNTAESSTLFMSGKRQKKTILSECNICGAPARYSYYGSIVCHSCKMFFRRNAENDQMTLKCDSGDRCETDVNNRRICPSCRLAKCFANGMRAELIRSSRPTKTKRNQKKKLIIPSTSTVLPRLNKQQSEQIPTSNLLHSDQSTLTIDQWNLISNLVQNVDEHSGYSFVERFIHDQNALPLKLRFKYSSVCDFFTLMTGKFQSVFEKNRDLLSLSSHDRSALLLGTVEYTASLAGMFILQQAQLLDYPSFYQSTETMFRPAAITFLRCAIDHLDSDTTFIKIILAVLSFSTINYTVYTKSRSINLTNIKALLPIQDTYTELAWRYLLYKYGHHQAVKRFSTLIRCLFKLNEAIVEVYGSQQFTDIVDSVIEQTEQLHYR